MFDGLTIDSIEARAVLIEVGRDPLESFATSSLGWALGPPESSPGHGFSIPSAALGRWCGCIKGRVPTCVTQETPRQFLPTR